MMKTWFQWWYNESISPTMIHESDSVHSGGQIEKKNMARSVVKSQWGKKNRAFGSVGTWKLMDASRPFLKFEDFACCEQAKLWNLRFFYQGNVSWLMFLFCIFQPQNLGYLCFAFVFLLCWTVPNDLLRAPGALSMRGCEFAPWRQRCHQIGPIGRFMKLRRRILSTSCSCSLWWP